MSSEIIELLTRINKISLDHQIVIVGGAIRDFLMKNPLWCVDIDLMTDKPVHHVAESCKEQFNGIITYHPKFGTAKLQLDIPIAGVSEIDFAQARTETYKTSGALPDVTFASIGNDLYRRDFTINAMAVRLDLFINASQTGNLCSEDLIDPTNGIEDLNNKIIKIIHDKSFKDDPTRMFRALRYMGRYRFDLDVNTQKAFQEAVNQKYLANISDFRVAQEIKKTLEEDEYLSILQLLIQYKMSHKFFDSFMHVAIKEVKDSQKQDRFPKFLAAGCRFSKDDPDKFLGALSLSKSSKSEVLKWL